MKSSSILKSEKSIPEKNLRLEYSDYLCKIIQLAFFPPRLYNFDLKFSSYLHCCRHFEIMYNLQVHSTINGQHIEKAPKVTFQQYLQKSFFFGLKNFLELLCCLFTDKKSLAVKQQQ